MELSRWNAGAGIACLGIGFVGQLVQHLVTPLPAADTSAAEQVAAAAAHPAAMAWAAALDVPLLLVIPAVLWIGWAAGGGRSVLAALGTGLAFAGMLYATYLTAGDVVLSAAAGAPDRAAGIAVVEGYLGDGVVVGAVAALLLGEVVGFVLLGVALTRRGSVPLWSAVGLGVFPLLDVAGHLTGVSPVGTVGYAVAALSVVPVARLLLGASSSGAADRSRLRAAAS